MVKIIYKIARNYSEKQLLKTKKQHEIFVAVMITMSICCFLFNVGELIIYVVPIAIVRVANIFIHNICVAFFDKYSMKKDTYTIIENISSYKRMMILNMIVMVELIMWTKYTYIFYTGIAMIPTLYLICKCIDKFIEKEMLSK